MFSMKPIAKQVQGSVAARGTMVTIDSSVTFYAPIAIDFIQLVAGGQGHGGNVLVSGASDVQGRRGAAGNMLSSLPSSYLEASTEVVIGLGGSNGTNASYSSGQYAGAGSGSEGGPSSFNSGDLSYTVFGVFGTSRGEGAVKNQVGQESSWLLGPRIDNSTPFGYGGYQTRSGDAFTSYSATSGACTLRVKD